MPGSRKNALKSDHREINGGFKNSMEISRSPAPENTRTALKDMQAGDLVFYARDGAVYHVTMYIGDGKIVHAGSEQYGIVIGWALNIVLCHCFRKRAYRKTINNTC